MRIDLHIHSNGSDGRMTLEEILQEAIRRNIGLISITDHDSLDSQESAKELSDRYGIRYVCGIELNVTFSYLSPNGSRSLSLDFLGYQYDIRNQPLVEKLKELREYREKRAERILDRINQELAKEKLQELTREDMEEIRNSVDGTFGRPHIANYLVKKGFVATKQEAFDRYLVRCNVPKMPLSLAEASSLIRGAGGKLIFAHPNHPRGTSLITLTASLEEQQAIISETMLDYIDGVECWHSSHDQATTESYLSFARNSGLMVTGGSDCHQQPLLLGTVDVPGYVAEEFGVSTEGAETHTRVP